MAAPTPDLIATWAPTGRKLTYPWTWVDITPYVRRVSVSRGRQSELDQIKPGTAKLVLENTSRIFDPANAAGSYYGDLGRGRPLRLGTGYRYRLDALNPLTYLPLDDASGSSFVDMRAWNNGTLVGSDISYAGQGPLTALTDGSVRLNAAGTTSAITQPHSATYDLNTHTLACWVKFTTSATHTIASKGYTGFVMRVGPAGAVTIEHPNSGTDIVISAATMTSQNDTTWYHVVWTKNGTGAGANAVYVNGVAISLSTNAAANIVDSDSLPLQWGRQYASTSTYSNYARARFAHLAWFNTVLTANQVAALYASLTSPCAAIFTGLTEEIPQSFNGRDATVEMAAVDASAFLQEDTADDASTYATEVLSDSPWGWWRMQETVFPEGTKAMIVTDHSGNNRHARHNSSDVSIGGQPIVGPSPSVSYPRSDALGVYTAVNESAAQLTPPTPGFSFEAWVQFDETPSSSYNPDFGTIDNPLLFMMMNPIGTSATQYGMVVRLGLRHDEPGNAHASRTNALWVDWTDDPQSGDGSNLITSEGYTLQTALGPYEQSADIVTLFDGQPHHVCVTAGSSFPASNDFLVYVDGVVSQVWGDATVTAPMREHIGQAWMIRWGEQLGGRMSEVAVYDTELSAGTVLSHYQAGARDWTGDMAGERIAHILDGVGWPTLLRDLDTGTTVVSNFVLAGVPATAAMDACSMADDGLLYLDPRGYVTFVGRRSLITDSRFSTVQLTFTDQRSTVTTSSIHGYVLEAFTYNVDRKLLQNVVEASAIDPSVDYYRTVDATSMAEQGKSAESVTLPVVTRTDLKGWADTRLALYKDPLLRLEPLVVFPDDRPAAHRATGWQKLLGLDLGHAVTTIRTPRTGSAISLTSRVEMIEHEIGPDFWRVAVSVSARQAGETIWTLGTSALGAAKITW